MTDVLKQYVFLRAEGVRKAAAALDILVPDWATRVDVERLEMTSHCNCVLGQVFHVEALASIWSDHLLASGYGYGKPRVLEIDPNIYSPVFACGDFRDEWCKAIAARLTPEPPVVTWTHRERSAQIAAVAVCAALCLAVYLL